MSARLRRDEMERLLERAVAELEHLAAKLEAQNARLTGDAPTKQRPQLRVISSEQQ